MIFDWRDDSLYMNSGVVQPSTTTFVADGEGNIFSLNLSGTLTPTGLVLKAGKLEHTGMIVLSGTLAQEAHRVFSGQVDSTSNIGRAVDQSQSGSTSFVGSLSRSIAAAISGSVSFLGTFFTGAGQFSLLIARTLLLHGGVRKESRQTVSRSLMMVGTALVDRVVLTLQKVWASNSYIWHLVANNATLTFIRAAGRYITHMWLKTNETIPLPSSPERPICHVTDSTGIIHIPASRTEHGNP